ncbi:MAG: hypothetical protein J7639_01515 [Paenibacillaceae bacterium]|nr:hypothetical protein [Paenibacillaceae bacterium]
MRVLLSAASVLALGAVLLAGCGQKPRAYPAAESFAAGESASTVGAELAAAAATLPSASAPVESPSPPVAPAASVQPAAVSPSQTAQAAASPAAAPSPMPSSSAAAAPTASAPAKPAAEQPSPNGAAAPSAPPANKPAGSSNTIDWSQFFDDDKQATPSNRFWDLGGQKVQIKGFMGEVLSFEKHWFLLIPSPGSECPFDNGDATYWNKIMIVFVPDDVKLRYTEGPLLITGRLDVGIKLDQSGYKTMFRLYDASFERIKE